MEEKNYTPQNNHTQEKLRVFSSYLDIYLTILLSSIYIRRVHIYDMFAGKGKYETDERTDEGSAALALKIIKKHREKSEKDVRLYLNDRDPDNYKSLCEIAKLDNWVTCQGIDANDAINKHIKDMNSKFHKLFYLDPFGYSQIKKKTLDRIIHSPNSECLLFVPVTRIAQFVRRDSTMDEQLLSIKNFLEKYHIKIEDHKDADWRKWGLIIKNAFAKIYPKQFVGMAELDTSTHNNYYALYFIGGHILGLDKFVETVAKWESKREYQLKLFSSEDKEIINYLLEGTKTNIDLYIWGLKQGWTPSKTREVLTNLENEEKIIIKNESEKTRGKNAFYIGANYYRNYSKDKKIKIEVSLNKYKE